jgi:VCBS repeat-containing protein
MNRWRQTALAALALALAGCSGEAAPNTRGVYLLMDTSGTYTQELDKAQALINALLAKLDTGDSFAVARVDTGSFSEKDIVARVTFDERPSATNQQKRKFREEIDRFVRQVTPAAYTDITGGILQAAEYLTKLRSDNVDPREYMIRLEDWQRKVESGGGSWRVINDLDRLDRILG